MTSLKFCTSTKTSFTIKIHLLFYKYLNMNKFTYVCFYETYNIANTVKAISFFIRCDIDPKPKSHWGQRKGFYWCFLYPFWWGWTGREGRSRWRFSVKIQRGASNWDVENFHLRTFAHTLQKTWTPTRFKREYKHTSRPQILLYEYGSKLAGQIYKCIKKC